MISIYQFICDVKLGYTLILVTIAAIIRLFNLKFYRKRLRCNNKFGFLLIF
jgi:hypothetical protein